MADAGGFSSKMGIIQLTDWADPYLAPSQLIPFQSEDVSVAYQRIEDDSLVGSASRGPSAQGGATVTGTTNHVLDYNNFGTLIKCAMGNVAGGVYTITNDDLPLYLLLEFEKTIQRHRFFPAKLSGFTISGRANEKVTIAFKWVVRKRTLSATAFPAISTPGARNLVLFSHLNFRIADQADAITGSAGTGDSLGITSFELEFSRVLKDDDFESGSTPKEIVTPVPSDWRVGSFKFTTARYNSGNSAVVGWKDSDTALQADLTFASGGESFKIELPNLRIKEGFDVPTEGPGQYKLDGALSMHPSQSGNPMYVGEEMRITIV